MAKGRELRMKSYTFKVVLERDKRPDEPDKEAIWRPISPSCPPSAHAWGDTPQEALENLIEEMIERGEPILEEPPSQVKISEEPLITVTVQTPWPSITANCAA